MVPAVKFKVLEHLNTWDEQETIRQVLALGSTWQAVHSQLQHIPLNSASLGVYRARLNNSLYRFLWFHPRKKTVIDFLSSSCALPEWFSGREESIGALKERMTLMHGSLGVGHYHISDHSDLVMDVSYGKSVRLKSKAKIKDRQTLISETKQAAFVFIPHIK